MKKFIITLMVLLSVVFATEAEQVNRGYKSLYKLTAPQLKVMLYAYKAGQPYDLGYTMAAIAWRESNFGQWPMNIHDGKWGSFGVFHILMESAASRNKLTTDWERSRFAEQLVFDIKVCADEAIAELTYWQRKFRNSPEPWKSMVAGYNAGHKALNSSAGRDYVNDIVIRVKALNKYFKAKGLEAKLAK